MSTVSPSPNGRNGRDGATGRFAKGWRGGPGNPLGGRVAELRSALVHAVSPDDIRLIAAGLVTAAKAGDVTAIRELLNRALGPPVQADILERLEALERFAAEREMEAERAT